MQRWLRFTLSCGALGIGAFLLACFVQIGLWTVFDPSSTAFIRAERWRLCGVNFWSCGVDRRWVPYEQISRQLKRAIIASEDGNFVNHDGIELDAMLGAWERNSRRGKVVAGGSTITQQLAKNLFFSSERSYIRKVEELLVTAMLELWLDKQRIYEIYLNSVEWGEGVFGAEAAARHYYRVSAANLSAGQAARLASALPAPKCFDKKSYCKNVHISFNAHAATIAGRMGGAKLPD